ncbi:amino acid adenylation domain-containing protein [Janthinobacterium sp. GMG1]|uniref:non-ribosomal peptide synthetase n=1 Tax=Janthinobacterium sp. GMG1 TaxID=3096007 RepID=UPI002ACAA55D|nr:amino acid adenylation domain-containing protein [Janthinobacterium sp. GMG1]MDZ5634895.1 amino acid adenylation domain-containing protein [Janthinobacterium sp. GMG1]
MSAPDAIALSAEQRAVPPDAAMLQLTVDIAGQPDMARLRVAADTLAARHTQLRAQFGAVDGYRGLRQWIAPPEAVDQALQIHATPQGCQLVLRLSALAADRRSMEILYRDLLRLYDGAALDEPLQYAEFVEWRRDIEQGDDGQAGRAYWANVGRQAPVRLAYRDGAAAGAQRAVQARELPAPVAASLGRLADAFGVPPVALLQAAWWALLARIQGHGSFSAGWQHDCRRDYAVMDGAVGVFEKILPLDIGLSLDEPFGDWLSRCAAMLEQHVQAQEFAPVAAPYGDAHFSAGFAVGELPAGAQVGDATFACGPLPASADVFELALLVELDPAGAARRLSVRHAPCYGAAAASRLLEQLATLLAALEEGAAEAISALPLVGAEERAALLALNGPAVRYGARTLPERVGDWARQTPGAPALQARGMQLDYAQLDERVNRLAHWLRAQGVGSDSIVALALPRSGDLVVALLAVLRAGGAYLPLEPEWPAARTAAILADARPLLLLTPNEEGRRGGVRCVSLAAIAPQLQAWPATAPEQPPDAAQAAYVLYTSGSTGTPKGVVVEHRHLLNYALAASEQLGLDGARRFALSSALAADLGNTALFGALLHGACLVVADAQDMESPAAFARFIRDGRIDCLKIVPSHLDALLDEHDAALPATIVLGGEAAPRRLLQRIHALAPASRVFNHYGPTETTIGVMTHAPDLAAPLPAVLPLTRVLSNCRVLVLDSHGALAATGSLGELHVGGAQLCRSYLNRPGALFVDDPLLAGEKLYRTGDLARYLPDGGLELAGRADHQLKLRGFRVEPGEVEAALLSLPGVRQAVVAPRGEDHQRHLVAWVVAHEGQQGQEEAWHAALRACLPEVMLPAAIVLLPQLPRLGNGKVDLRALPDPRPRQAAQGTRTEPATALEWLLAHLMGEVLEQETPGADDDFFALGGHSLLVIKLVGRIRKALQLEFAPGLVFDHATPAALARALSALANEAGRLEQVAGLRRQLAGMTPEACAALRQGAPA